MKQVRSPVPQNAAKVALKWPTTAPYFLMNWLILQAYSGEARVVEYGEFERVGGSKSVKLTYALLRYKRRLTRACRCKISQVTDRLALTNIPPLRERREDIMMLAENFAINMAREMEMELFSGFTEKAKRTLLDYDWPGNIRELKNVVERAVYRTNNPHLPVHEIVLDPFESAYRPKGRVKTNDRVNTSDSPVTQSPSEAAATNERIESADITPLAPVKKPEIVEYPMI